MFMRPPFPRPAEPPIKPQYIVLFKGDDSDFQGNQSVDIVIDTELDTTGMKAHFRFMDFVQDFDSIPENKTLSLVFPNAKTSEFPLGAADATLRFEDASGKFRTVSNRIHIVVTNSVHEAYDNEDSQSITVTVKGTVTWDMIEDKPTIPAPVTIDTALSTTSENPVQNKVVAEALFTGFTEWTLDILGEVPHPISVKWYDGGLGADGWVLWDNVEDNYVSWPPKGDTSSTILEWTNTVDSDYTATAARHLITPTKTSQLTNDGAPNGGGTPYATTAQVAAKQDALSSAQIGYINAVPSKADKAVPSAAGNLAALNAQGNLSDSGVKPSDFAAKADLPYALVTPGEWTFSDGGNYTIQGPLEDGFWAYYSPQLGWSDNFMTEADALAALSLTFDNETKHVTATRASLPGHLLDRAGNRVVVTGDTTLTLPALTEQGKLRDFLVRLEIGGSTVPTITFAAPTGETVTYETDGDEFPVPDEAGNWVYSFTENCVAHTFAVSLKKVNVVAQGGS